MWRKKENFLLSLSVLAENTAQAQSSFILQPVSGFLPPLSCRGRERPRLRDLWKPAALLPEHYLCHHWQLCHLCPGGGIPGLGAAPPAQAQQPDDTAGAPPAAPGAAVPPGGARPPAPLQRHLQRQQRHPVRGQPALPQARGPGLPALLFRGRARPKVCAGADAALTRASLCCLQRR